MVRKFAETEVEPIAADIDKEHRFLTETVRRWHATVFRAPLPGIRRSGGDNIAYAITVEELSRVCDPFWQYVCPYIPCGWPLMAYGTEEQREVPRACCKGEKLGAGLTEPNAGTDAADSRQGR